MMRPIREEPRSKSTCHRMCRTWPPKKRPPALTTGIVSWAAAVQKDVAFDNGTRLQFRWEIFNLMNHTNFDVPNRIAFTPNFGRIFNAKPSRQMQFGLKLQF